MAAASNSACLAWTRTFVASFLLAATAAVPSLATTNIVDSAGFESSAGYSLAPLVNQEGWQRSTFGIGSSDAVVQSGITASGTQAVQVDRGALSDDRWAVPVNGMGYPNNRYILIDWDMNVTGTGSNSGFGPFFGVESYRALAGNVALGTLGVDATTGDILYQQAGTGFFVETGSTVSFGQWNHFQILLDFEQDEYSVFLNDTFLLTSGFIDGPASTLADADISAIAAAGDAVSQNLTGTAYFDNFLVRDVSPADFEIDGDVDTDDLTLWQSSYGTTGVGDADFDGDSDGADFLIWQREFSSSIPLTAPLSFAVPEPSSLALLAFAVLGMGSRNRS